LLIISPTYKILLTLLHDLMVLQHTNIQNI